MTDPVIHLIYKLIHLSQRSCGELDCDFLTSSMKFTARRILSLN